MWSCSHTHAGYEYVQATIKPFGDNLVYTWISYLFVFVILNSKNQPKDLFKNHVEISFPMEQDDMVSRMVETYWINIKYNTSDIITKQILRTEFKTYFKYIYWYPDLYLHDENKLDDSYMQD